MKLLLVPRLPVTTRTIISLIDWGGLCLRHYSQLWEYMRVANYWYSKPTRTCGYCIPHVQANSYHMLFIVSYIFHYLSLYPIKRLVVDPHHHPKCISALCLKIGTPPPHIAFQMGKFVKYSEYIINQTVNMWHHVALKTVSGSLDVTNMTE